MRLIDADALDFTIPDNPHFMTATLVQVVKNAIDKAPTIEAEPVRHGRWEWRPVDDVTSVHTCSTCSNTSETWEDTNYCPHCGAKMESGTALLEAEPLAGCADDADLEYMTRFAMQQAINRK